MGDGLFSSMLTIGLHVKDTTNYVKSLGIWHNAVILEKKYVKCLMGFTRICRHLGKRAGCPYFPYTLDRTKFQTVKFIGQVPKMITKLLSHCLRDLVAYAKLLVERLQKIQIIPRSTCSRRSLYPCYMRMATIQKSYNPFSFRAVNANSSQNIQTFKPYNTFDIHRA